jgi:hypothetical protein
MQSVGQKSQFSDYARHGKESVTSANLRNMRRKVLLERIRAAAEGNHYFRQQA